MRDFKRPDFMQEAAKDSHTHYAFVEILIALVIFLVCTIAMSMIQTPFMMLFLMTEPKFKELVLSGEPMTEHIEELTRLMMNMPEWMMIVTLCSEIIMIGLIMLYCRYGEKRKITTMGFCKKKIAKNYVLGLLIGFSLFTLAYVLCVITGSIEFQGISKKLAIGTVIGYFVGYLIQGMAEEVLCRGYLFVSLSRRYSVAYSAVVSATFFSLLHGMNAGVGFLAFFNLFLFGLFASLLMLRFENIWIVGACHSAWNFVQGNLYGISVSGTRLQSSLFSSETNKSMGLMNGGSFGMEGGLCVTVVLCLGIGLLVWDLKKHGKIVSVPVFVGNSQSQPTVDSTVENEQAKPTQPEFVRQNMGTQPGETPWRPFVEPKDESANKEEAHQENDNNQTIFSADYFKD